MAYVVGAGDGNEADPDIDGASAVEMDPTEADPADPASSNLPAFLTEDGPSHAGLKGAASV